MAPSSNALPRIYAWFSALVSDDFSLMNDLLAHGLPVDVSHPLRHSTALMEATRLGRTAHVQWLLVRGASPAFLCGTPPSTPLHCALRRQQWHIAELLAASAPHGTVMDAQGATPLHAICGEVIPAAHQPQALALVARLIAKGCPLDALDRDGTTALHHCVMNNLIEIADLLLMRGANANALIPDSGVTPLSIAALEKNLPMAQLLMEHGADPALKTREGSTPLALCPSIGKLQHRVMPKHADASNPAELLETRAGSWKNLLARMQEQRSA